eukprot:jgi/Picsp_1/2065/NSC_05530-R1_glycine cleavage system h-protein
MALRKVASEAVIGLGIRFGPSVCGSTSSVAPSAYAIFSRGFAKVVDGLKYQKSHEYVKMDGDVATVGISDFAQSELGDVVYVELPEVGSELSKGETFGVVESVKAASDVYSPVSGEVVEINETLSDDPSKVNSEPFEGGWMMKIKVSNAGDVDALLDAGAYEAHCEAGGH